jgi:C1A family cysteine protease
MNPDFLTYLQKQEKSGQSAENTTTHALGRIPSPIDLSYLSGLEHPRLMEPEALPPTYDLRTLGKVTAIRNQQTCGTCWAFATYGSLESNLLPTEATDFSENNLKNLSGFDHDPCNGGGNPFMSCAYLTRWDGPISETDDPYHSWDDTSPSDLKPRKHVQEVLFLPSRTGPTDNNTIKQAVVTYGGVVVSMYWQNASYSSTNHSYYYSGTTAANHAIVVVGWDDDYPATKFLSTPPGNGAFIVRNSWGTGWGEAGYFYASYYDSKFSMDEIAVFNNAEPVNNYSGVYEYDPLGWVNSWGCQPISPTAWFANIFTAERDDRLSAVSFYAVTPNTSYTVQIRRDVTAGPASGTLAATKSGTLAFAGYHTIPLDTTVPVTAGQLFSAVVNLTTPGYNWPVPAEVPFAGYSSKATASSGQSYMSCDGTSWDDMTSLATNANVCLKIFAEATPALTAMKSGTGIGTVISSPSGIDCDITCTSQSAPFFEGTPVTITATPDPDSVFGGWTGSGCSGTGDCVVTITADTTVTATFFGRYDLVIQGSGNGSGVVSGNNITCSIADGVAGGDCDETILEGAPFTLTATSDPGSVFKGWTGGGCPATGPCELMLTANTTITATFIDTDSFTKVTMVSPNGGEKLLSGGNWTLVWGGPSEVASYKLSYSLNNGLTWKPIPTDTGTSTTWTLPLVRKNTTTCRTRVIGYNGATKVGTDKSDKPFTIEVLTITEPTSCTSGNPCTIAWTRAPNVNAYNGKLSYSTDGGFTWKMIANLIMGNDVKYESWRPTVGKTKKNCKVKLVYEDDNEKVVATATSRKFTINR